MAYSQFTLFEEYQPYERPYNDFAVWNPSQNMAQAIDEYMGVRGHSIMAELGYTDSPPVRWIKAGSVYNTTLICKFESPTEMGDEEAAEHGVPAGTPCIKTGQEEIMLRAGQNYSSATDYLYFKVIYDWSTLSIHLMQYTASSNSHTSIDSVSTPNVIEYSGDMEQYYLVKIELNNDTINVKFWQSIDSEPASPTLSATWAGTNSGHIILRQYLKAQFEGYETVNTTNMIFIHSDVSIDTEQYRSALIQGTVTHPGGTPVNWSGLQVVGFDKWERFPHIDAPDNTDIAANGGDVSTDGNGTYSFYLEAVEHYISPWPRNVGYEPNEQIITPQGGQNHTVNIQYISLSNNVNTLDRLWQIRYYPSYTFYLSVDLDLTDYNFRHRADHLADYGNWIPASWTTAQFVGYDTATGSYANRTIYNAELNQITNKSLAIPIRERNYMSNAFFRNSGRSDQTEGPTLYKIDFKNIKVTSNLPYIDLVFSYVTCSSVQYCNGQGTINAELYYNGSPVAECVGGMAGLEAGSAGASTTHSFNEVEVTINGPGIIKYVGGYIGQSYLGQVNRTFTKGSITAASANYVGGFVGNHYNDNYYNYSRCSVVGNNYVGGYAGYNHSFIADAYSTGSVNGSSNVGGFCGYNSGIIQKAYYDLQTAGQSDTGKGVPRTTEEMTYPFDMGTTYIDWDFGTMPPADSYNYPPGVNPETDSVEFVIYEVNDGYPALKAVDGYWWPEPEVGVVWVKKSGIWYPAEAYIKSGGVWYPVALLSVKKSGIWS